MKALVIGWIVLLTLYAPAELTRLIIEYGFNSNTILELILFWSFYLIAIRMLTILVKVKDA